MMRIGQGYDVHKLKKNNTLVLGGVVIPSDLGTVAHSDGDVLIHSIIDALLGAACLRDIGYNFPDSNDEFSGISSLILLNKTYDMLCDKKYVIENIDSTIVLQSPKISVYIDEMRKNIANILNIDISSISIKATTEEKLGFTGRLDGISAMTVCLLK